ncbi:MAG: HEPN domain-containing protein [Bacteroidales bacterium]|nr:HEPN domain-containing protein [Bacteroidales bacterium]
MWINFIKSGKIDKKYRKLFTKLFDLRQKGDYGNLFDHDEESVKPLIAQTKEFIEEIKKYIL